MRAVLNVPAISCDHCKRAIEEALMPIGGVESVDVSVPTKQVAVDFDERVIGLDRLMAILQEEEYPVESVS